MTAERVAELKSAIEDIIPLGSNGLIDHLWSLCRRHGQNHTAEEITAKSNRVRAALYALQQDHGTTSL